jgi:hypothetical protein
MLGSYIMSDRPTLSWKAEERLVDYQIRVWVTGDPTPLWTATTTELSLPYPLGQKPLTRGRKHTWRVVGRDAQRVERSAIEGDFTVASVDAARRLADLETLAAGDDPADVLAAALVYRETYGAHDAALGTFERLMQLVPDEPSYAEALAFYYERAGRPADAAKARARVQGRDRPSPESP